MDTLMGAETEYALAVVDGKGNRSDPEGAAHALLKLAMKRYPYLTSADGQGIFLANGGKFYIDVGHHPEYATPECPTPWDLVRYTLAGDRIMAQLAQDLGRSRDSSSVLVFRGNTGYGGRPESWACHESHLCRRSPAEYADGLIPFLVSRLIFAGSGGFDPFSPGIAFTLSPRSHFLTTVTNTDTMRSRPILNLRDEPLAGNGYHRLHLICADAVGSETATWLRAGTTALVIALLDAGGPPTRDMTLRDPLKALRTFAADPTLKATAPTADGKEVSALELQRRYLALAREQLSRSGLPVWAPPVLEGWERTLTLLQEEPAQLETVLDWTIKRAVYADFCASRGIPWSDLPHWTHVATRLDQAWKQAGRSSGRLTLERTDEPVPVREEAQRLSAYLETNGLDRCDLPRFLSLRMELQELDTRFLQLGGIFQNLDQEGALDHQVLTDAGTIDAAVLNPPAAGRAAVRGRFVREMAKSDHHRCGWSDLIDTQSQQTVALSDPLQTVSYHHPADWKDLRQTEHFQIEDIDEYEAPVDLRSTALACYRRGDYAQAEIILEALRDAGFELPGTHCHLARIALVTDNLIAAAEHTERAWELREQAPSYVLPRILWLQIALSMLMTPDRPLALLIGKFKTAFQATQPYDWTMGPTLNHLQNRLPAQDHALLAALAAVLSDRAQLAHLEEFPAWQVAPQPLD